MKNVKKQFQRLLFFGGVFNVLIAAPFLFPNLIEDYLSLLWKMNEILNLGGNYIPIDSKGITGLLINIVGIGLTMVGIFVFYAGLKPGKRKTIPLINAIGRLVFVVLAVYYVINFDVIKLVLIIGLIDFLISLGFAYYLLKLRRSK